MQQPDNMTPVTYEEILKILEGDDTYEVKFSCVYFQAEGAYIRKSRPEPLEPDYPADLAYDPPIEDRVIFISDTGEKTPFFLPESLLKAPFFFPKE